MMITVLRQLTVRLSSFLSWEGVSDSFFSERQYGRWDYGEERHLDSEGRLTKRRQRIWPRYRVQVTVLCPGSRFLELTVDGDRREGQRL